MTDEEKQYKKTQLDAIETWMAKTLFVIGQNTVQIDMCEKRIELACADVVDLEKQAAGLRAALEKA